MSSEKLDSAMKSWARIGGILGLITMIFLFGFGGSSGAAGILDALVKGLISATIGAGIFAGLAGIVHGPEFGVRIVGVIFVVLLSVAALFLAQTFSPKFNSLVGQNNAVVALSELSATGPPSLHVVVHPHGIEFKSDSIDGLGTLDDLINAYEILSADNPGLRVTVTPRGASHETIDEVVDKLQSAGSRNIRILPNKN